MAIQQYGFRTTNNLAEVIDADECIDNLKINRADLPLLEGTSAAGVVSADYQAIIGLSSNLEQQIVTLSGYAASQASGIAARASKNGDTFTGNIIADTVNNDRPYTTQAGSIIGPSTASFFSPTASGLFSTGGEYKLGGVTATTITSSGVNYTGTTKPWNTRYSRYKNYAQLQEQPSWTVRYVPLFLPPPTSIDGCVAWFDSEFSEIILDDAGAVAQWKSVNNGPSAIQNTIGERPLYVTNVLNGKPAIRFDGTNDNLSLGNLSGFFPNAATLVCKVRILDGDYNIYGTLNNTSNRWNNGGGSGTFGLFTTALQSGFPALVENNGTFVFSVRIKEGYGLEVRGNNVPLDYKASGFTFTGGDSHFMGKSGGASGFLNGDIYALALFNRVLTDKEVRTMEEYFAWRYDGIYDPDRAQQLQLEDFATIDLEDGSPLDA